MLNWHRGDCLKNVFAKSLLSKIATDEAELTTRIEARTAHNNLQSMHTTRRPTMATGAANESRTAPGGQHITHGCMKKPSIMYLVAVQKQIWGMRCANTYASLVHRNQCTYGKHNSTDTQRPILKRVADNLGGSSTKAAIARAAVAVSKQSMRASTQIYQMVGRLQKQP